MYHSISINRKYHYNFLFYKVICFCHIIYDRNKLPYFVYARVAAIEVHNNLVQKVRKS